MFIFLPVVTGKHVRQRRNVLNVNFGQITEPNVFVKNYEKSLHKNI